MKTKIKAYFQEHAENLTTQITNLLKEMVRQKTINASPAALAKFPEMQQPGEESKVVAIAARECEQAGIRYEIHEGIPGRGNILSYYGGSNDPSLLIGCHLDVVPPGDGWESDPFEPYFADGKVFGRGVLDNKGPYVSALVAMKVLQQLAIPLRGKLIVAGIASEEYRAADKLDPGIGYLMQEGLLKPTWAVIPDIGENMAKIDIAEKGRVEIVITSHGVQAHGSTPERGKNAVTMMAHLLTRLEQFTMSFEPHPYLIAPSLNVGLIQAGSAANIVPAKCEVVLDIRYLPGQTPEQIISEIEALTKDIDGRFTFLARDNSLPHQVDPDNPLVTMVASSTEEVLGHKPEPFGLGGGTFAKTFNLNGIPAVGFGPGDDFAFHVANEYVEVQQLVDFAQILCILSCNLLS